MKNIIDLIKANKEVVAVVAGTIGGIMIGKGLGMKTPKTYTPVDVTDELIEDDNITHLEFEIEDV